MAWYRNGSIQPGLGCMGGTVLTPSDATNETHIFRAVYVGGAGNLNVVNDDNSTLLFTAVPAGSIIPIHGKRIQATGTTATLLVGIW